MQTVRREKQETASYSTLTRDAVAEARSFIAALERPGLTVESVRLAEKRLSSVLAELRMVAAALADTHINPV